jgi:hypothetical protein
VGFWNLSGRDVTLQVESARYLLAQGKSLRFQLGRQFTWKVDDRTPEDEVIPATAPGVEIVIRH